jgi:DNA-binding transcriptional ArsR family regulator
MRPLFHPSIENVTVEGILHALSDPVRVAILADIIGANCARNCSNFLKVNDREIPKATLSQHFKVLRDAGLIRGVRQGVEIQNTARCSEIETRFPGLVASIVNAYKTQLQEKNGATRARKRKRSDSD